MTLKTPYRKGTVLIPTGSKDHLHFICNDPVLCPVLGSDSVLAVNLTSINYELKFDNTCVLTKDEHPFVAHDSYVFYKKAGVYSAEKMNRAVESGEYKVHKDVSDEVFRRILDGFSVSTEVPHKVKRYYEKNCL